jgi:fatty-acyl-CoA synthase
MYQKRALDNSWYHRTTQSLFAETCATQPDKTALVFEDEKTSFAELKQRVDRLSQALLDLGIDKGDVVSMLPSPTPEFACLYYAVLQIGAVINPLNLLWGVLEFEGVLPRNDPKLIVTVDHYGNRDYIQILKSAIPDLMWDGETASSAKIPALTGLVCMSRQGKRHEGFIDFNDLLARGTDCDAAHLSRLVQASRPTDIQFMCQTSGTTGLSKTALWDHRPPLASVNFAAKSLCYTENEAYLNLTPFYHNSGLFALNLNLTLTGCTLYLMEQFNPAKALDIIDKYGITSTFGFDAHWQGMSRAPNFLASRFTITKAVIAGEPKTYDLVRGMCPPGATVNNLYAQTENGPGVSFGDHDCMDYDINKHTHGRPLPGVQLIIKCLDTGERLPQGQAGEICYKSPFMFRGYHRQEQETREAFDADGYFHSGDFGSFDNGYITFLGRLGGVIKSGGENVSTLRVTNLLLELFKDEFDDAKTIGIPDPYWGTKVVSFVRTLENKPLQPTLELRERCKGFMAAYEIPQEFIAWKTEWPMSPEGKIDFRVLEKEALSQLAGA